MKKYAVVKNAITDELRQILYASMHIMKDAEYFVNGISLKNKNHFTDTSTVTSNAWPVYGSPVTDALLIYMKPLIEEVTEKKLLPTYSYGRIHWQGSSMPKHTDRPSCEYSITLCISSDGADKPWPIYMDGNEVILNPGDLCIYKGIDVPHWRDEFQGTEHIQVFLHYVDQEGPYTEWVYDKRQVLGTKVI